MPPEDWEFVIDDDDQAELWRDADGNEQWVEREGPPLYEIPADEIQDEPLYGPPQ